MIGLRADDKRYYPFFEKCVKLDIPLSIRASANWTTTRVSDLGHPRHFDAVACDFPQLKLILSHAGYPWVLEACLLAWKHPNLYLELAAHRPQILCRVWNWLGAAFAIRSDHHPGQNSLGDGNLPLRSTASRVAAGV
jgi:predicted TIM-barrel fold metal-dependent hydrolase